MKKKTPFLDFYRRCMERGEMPGIGLCTSEPFNEFPFESNERKAFQMLHPHIIPCEMFWGSGYKGSAMFWDFTPLRQTIVLFCAAINGEL